MEFVRRTLPRRIFMKIDMEIEREIMKIDERTKGKARKIRGVYCELFKANTKILTNDYFEDHSVIDALLAEAYIPACNILDGHHNKKEMTRTLHEKNFEKWINHLRIFNGELFCSLRVSVYSIDFYCPSKAIAIEIDGPVHEQKVKQKKDNRREFFLYEEFGIRTLHICNHYVNKEYVSKVLQELKRMKPINYNRKKRITRQIKIATLLALFPSEMNFVFSEIDSPEWFRVAFA